MRTRLAASPQEGDVATLERVARSAGASLCGNRRVGAVNQLGATWRLSDRTRQNLNECRDHNGD